MRKYCGIECNSVLAFYKGFESEFYYPDKETKRACKFLIERLKNDNSFGDFLYKSIMNLSKDLFKVFNKYSLNVNFGNLKSENIVDLYRSQFNIHTELYNVAWATETLQAKRYGLYDYLYNYLFLKTNSAEESKQVLNDLHEFDEITSFKLEDYELIKLAKSLLKKKEFKLDFTKTSTKSFASLLPEEIHNKMRKIYLRYSYLQYHGLKGLGLPKIDYLYRKLFNLLKNKGLLSNTDTLIPSREAILKKKKRLFRKYGINKQYQNLFLSNTKFGISKSFRRLAQLKNFYYTDKLLEEIAIRLNIKINELLFISPDQVIDLIKKKKSYLKNLKNKSKYFLYLYKDKKEFVESGEKAKDIRKSFTKGIKPVEEKVKRLYGQPAYYGQCTGKAFVIDSLDESFMKDFKKGDILVAIDLDPDFMPYIIKSGAVIVSQGGITAHSAIIAREFKIPCIVAVKDITKLIKTGNILNVNSTKGEIEILR